MQMWTCVCVIIFIFPCKTKSCPFAFIIGHATWMASKHQIKYKHNAHSSNTCQLCSLKYVKFAFSRQFLFTFRKHTDKQKKIQCHKRQIMQSTTVKYKQFNISVEYDIILNFTQLYFQLIKGYVYLRLYLDGTVFAKEAIRTLDWLSSWW